MTIDKERVKTILDALRSEMENSIENWDLEGAVKPLVEAATYSDSPLLNITVNTGVKMVPALLTGDVKQVAEEINNCSRAAFMLGFHCGRRYQISESDEELLGKFGQI